MIGPYELKDAIWEKAEELGWTINWIPYENGSGELTPCAEFNMTTPAGEDFRFDAFYNWRNGYADIVDEVAEEAEYFDVDRHVYVWLGAKFTGVNGVPGAAELVDDAKYISGKLEELSLAMKELRDEMAVEFADAG